MTGVEHYLSIFTKAVFIENIVLAYFLGLCSFLAISKKIDASVGIGLAVIVVPVSYTHLTLPTSR